MFEDSLLSAGLQDTASTGWPRPTWNLASLCASVWGQFSVHAGAALRQDKPTAESWVHRAQEDSLEVPVHPHLSFATWLCHQYFYSSLNVVLIVVVFLIAKVIGHEQNQRTQTQVVLQTCLPHDGQLHRPSQTQSLLLLCCPSYILN